ncbi:lipoprotein [Actinomadura cremea]|nr:lipoprotein [Actinomadura cremea]
MICGSTRRARWGAPATALAAGVLLAACGGSGGDGGSAGAEPTPHGYVEGAEETAETQWRLVLADPEGGRIHTLDPATGETADAGEVPGVTAARSDGRFAYLTTGQGLRVFDGGTWTVDHGDHVHYYRADARMVGDVDAAGTSGVSGDIAVTALATGGRVRVLDREALDAGRIEELARVAGGPAVAYAEHLVAAAPESGEVTVHDRAGRRLSRLPEACPDPRGQATTRRGAVLGCADGALLVTHEDGTFQAAKIAYPGEVPADERAAEFRHRPGSDVLAARAGGDGAWVLDVRAREWHRVGTGRPALAVNAVGGDSPVLLLGRDGALRSYDPATGAELAETGLLETGAPERDAPGAAAPVIEVDTARAYVNDPAARAVHEIDYNDDLRVARTFDLPFSPAHMVETGW